MTVRIGVIGTGLIGTDHVHRLAREVPGAEVSGVFDVVTEKAKELADEVGATVHDSAEECLHVAEAEVAAAPGGGSSRPRRAGRGGRARGPGGPDASSPGPRSDVLDAPSSPRWSSPGSAR